MKVVCRSVFCIHQMMLRVGSPSLLVDLCIKSQFSNKSVHTFVHFLNSLLIWLNTSTRCFPAARLRYTPSSRHSSGTATTSKSRSTNA